MRRGVWRFWVGFLGFMAAGALVPQSASGEEPARFIVAGLATLTPMGWADFCYRYKNECSGGPTSPADIEATPANLALLERVNRRVNHDIEPKSDLDHWNVVDRWDLPTDGYGDCEDYVLLKRKLLIEAGLPRSALLVTIVRDEMNEGHAVLTAKTTRGEFILDNMNEQVKIWSRTPYRFVKRQSQDDQNVWISIGKPVETARVLVIPGPAFSGRIAQH